MKCVIVVLSTVATLMLGVLVAGTGYANISEDAGEKCSEATLHGRYLFAFDGFEIKGNDKVVPFAQAGYEVYGGNGKMNGALSGNFDGEITRNESFSGTYAVKADCTGTLRYTDGTRYDLFLAPDGSQFTFVQTNPEFVGAGFEPQGTAKRVGE
jgi:hypothetical protein